MSPSSGPGRSSQATFAPRRSKRPVAIAIETTVMPKPIEIWMANAAPTRLGGHARAERAENCGESATTAAPQTSSSARSATGGNTCQPSAKIKQQSPESDSDTAATPALLHLWLKRPPTTHPNAPAEMMAKASPETLTLPMFTLSDVRTTSKGTMVQNA